MLDLTTKRSYTTTDGRTWDFYGDDTDTSLFYVVPLPVLARDGDGRPVFKLVEYSTTGAQASAGYCYLATDLIVPPDDMVQIVAYIRQLYPGITPVTNTLEFRSGGVATIRYVLDDGFARELNTTPSGFGSNRATFVIPLSPTGLALFKAVFGGTTANGAISIVYRVSVDSRLPAVEVTVKFDSATAYEYQVRKTIKT